MAEIWLNLVAVLFFVLIGGFFAAAEMALVSLRESQIEHVKEEHPRSGARLEKLFKDPNRFLAAAQVGVTLAGFISAGFGASRIAPEIAPWFESLGLPEGLSATIAFILVTVVIAYLSLVLGELVPKRLALQRSEMVARRVSGVVDWVAVLATPFIWLLSVSTDALVRVLGGDPDVDRERITQEELRGLVASHTELSDRERELIDEVFDAGDMELREVMIPRTEVAFLKSRTTLGAAAAEIASQPHSRFPVINRGPDDIVGFVHMRDILNPAAHSRSATVGSLARTVLTFPGTKRVIPALTEMRDSGEHLAIVIDEYGGTDGIVTLEDLVEELVGEITDEFDPEKRPDVQLTGSAELDGLLNLEDFEERTGLTLPEGPYETLAGFVVDRLGRLPHQGDTIQTQGYLFTVVEMDSRRIERVLVEAQAPGVDVRLDQA